MEALYTAVATATKGGRTGHVQSSDKAIDLQLSMPKELGGPGGTGTNPEQLFAAGYAACFDSALNLVARTKRIKVEETEITARVTIGKDEQGGFQLAAQLDIKIAGVDSQTAQELAAAAHQVCPYSKATRGNIDVTLNVINPSEA